MYWSIKKINLTIPKKAVMNIKSVPNIRLSASPSTPSVSIAKIVKGCCCGLALPGYKQYILLIVFIHLVDYYLENLDYQMYLWKGLRSGFPLKSFLTLYFFIAW